MRTAMFRRLNSRIGHLLEDRHAGQVYCLLPALASSVQKLQDRFRCGSDTGKVRHRLEPKITGQAGNYFESVALGAAAGSISYRDKKGIKLRQPFPRLRKIAAIQLSPSVEKIPTK